MWGQLANTEVFYGSVLNLLVHFVMPGEPAANLAVVFLRCKALYKELGVRKENRYSALKLTMFKAEDGSCKLRGKT